MPEAPLRSLTREEIETYDRDGVVCLSGLFSDHWIRKMEKAIDHAVANPTTMGRAVSMKDEAFSGDLFLWKVDNEFCDFVYESPASIIAQQLLGSTVVRHFYDQLFVKPAGCHVPTPWHHDVTFWPVRLDSQNLCSLWITFDPVDRNSSGLEFVKGSHRWPERFKAVTPNYDPYMLDSDLAEVPDIDADRESYDLFCPDMQPGDLLLFNPLIVHGSSANYSTERPRRALASRWCDDSIVFEHRHATMPLMFDHGLADGDTLAGSLFPQILPEPIAEENARRLNGPEQPDQAIIHKRLNEMAEGMRTA
ncbi:MAG: phytanoyl-CoA dioxygenase family protein [bacterium]|nr:phytanoyl-CoA dioxygenase family protein [Gammaproteobacteria bacterium]HIL95928.1 phytanoyl-CoA dioxygenase family protein [Pseudomonadales bacterium]